MTEEKNSKKTNTQKAVKQKNNEIPTTQIYVGPSFKNGLLVKNSIFKGALPTNILEHKNKNAVINELFVTPEQLSDVQKEINVKGTKWNQLYVAAVSYVEGGHK